MTKIVKASGSLLIVACLLASACKKTGMNSEEAKKIQFHWSVISHSKTTDYLDGRAISWTVIPALQGAYMQFDHDAYFYTYDGFSIHSKFDYKVEGDKIMYLGAAASRATTPQYTDTFRIQHVDDTLLVLTSQKYFSSGAYSYVDRFIDSLKK